MGDESLLSKMPQMAKEYGDAFTTYFRYNNARTLSTSIPSQLKVVQTEEATLYIDPTRFYDNLIVIHKTDAEPLLENLLTHYNIDALPEISVEPSVITPSLSKALIAQEYYPSYSHEFLVFDMDNYHASIEPSGFCVERWEQDKADDFFALLNISETEGSAMQYEQVIWDSKRQYYCNDTFRCYVALWDGIPCGWATMFIDGKLATLANAYTKEMYRGRGCQTALLRARIDDARLLGMEQLLIDVTPDTVSSRNCKAIGFSTVTIRTVWEKLA